MPSPSIETASEIVARHAPTPRLTSLDVPSLTCSRAAQVRVDAGYETAAFFHFQEWKKKFKSFSGHLPALPTQALLGTKYGVISVPPLAPPSLDDVMAAARRRARSLEYCAFKACPGVGAFGRDDLRWAFSRDRQSPLDVSPSGGAPFVAPVDREAGAALVVAASLEHEDAPRRLETSKP